MPLKGKWKDKVNGVDVNSADDINMVAHAVLELEEKEPAKPVSVDYIPVPTTATVGQTIRVSAVDESGKPTAWESVDFPEGGGGGNVELDTTLSQSGKAADAKAVGDALAKPVDYESVNNKPSINGVILSGNKTTDDLGIYHPTDEQAESAIRGWLDEHPEATTTVQDGSITKEKLGADVFDVLWEQIYDGEESGEPVEVFAKPADYELGGLQSATGAGSGGTIRIRTIGYLDKTVRTVQALEGYKIGACVWNANGSYVGAYDGSSLGNFAWVTSMQVGDLLDEGHQIKLTVKRVDDGNMTVSEASNVIYFKTGPVFVALNERVDTIEEEILELKNDERTGRFANRLWDYTEKKNVYEAWPFGNAWYDKTTGKHCLIVNAKSTHGSKDGDVYFTSKDDFGEFAKPTLVAKHTADYGCRTHGSGINAKGEYLALVIHQYDGSGNGQLFVYKSSDKGKTWSSYELLIDGSNPISGETGSCFLTSTGKLLSFNRLAPSPSAGCMIIYSDNDGESWTGTKINNGTAPNPLEGSFVELSNGNVYCVVRGSLGGADTTIWGTYITKSTDGGVTWTALEEMDDMDASRNGVAFVHHKKAKKVEILYASRFLQPNGLGSLYRRICTEAEFESGYYGEEVKIANGGSVGADFGYVAASVSDKNVVNMYYYITDRKDGGVCIMNAELDWIY